MRILISADIEGVANVFHPEQTRAGNGEYERARRWMTAEADAAVRGAFDGGATEVLVNDSHGGFRNLIPDSIDRRARFVLGKPRYLSMMAGVEGCNAVCMIGYHARAGSRGVLAHTINSFAFTRVWFNEQELGEAGIYGALASARLAAGIAGRALAAGTVEHAALAEYQRKHAALFWGKGTVEAIIQSAVQFPPLMNHVAAQLSRRKAMADTLLGVTGDFLPTSAVLNPRYLARLVI